MRSALSQGERVAGILLIHPMGSAWCLYRPQAARDLPRFEGRGSLEIHGLHAAAAKVRVDGRAPRNSGVRPGTYLLVPFGFERAEIVKQDL